MTGPAQTAYLGLVIVASAMLLALPWWRAGGRWRAIAALFVTGLAGVVPVDGLALFGYVRGVTGDLSMTSVAVALWSMVNDSRIGTADDRRDRAALGSFVAMLAVALYPMTLGLTLFDPYRYGYGDAWFVGALIMVALFAWWRGFARVPVVIAAALLAWVAGWYESTNLWDYLIDFFVAIYACAQVLWQAARRASGQAGKH